MTTPLPPGPTFNRESVAIRSADGPAAALTSPAGAAAGSPIPDGYVLVERALLIKLQGEIVKIQQERDEMRPAFLRNPSWKYLEAVQRGAE